MDRLYEGLGLTPKASIEFNTPNIQCFNEVCPDAKLVDYYSIGAKKSGATMSKMLQNGFEVLVGREWGDQCDGLVRDVEARWGRYLITFENDHMEVMGFEPEHDPANVFNLVADNVRLCEIKNNKSLRLKYGVMKD